MLGWPLATFVRHRCDYGLLMRTIVVGVDGSPEGNSALRWAQALAGPEDTVKAVFAWTYPVDAGMDMDVGFATSAIPYQDLEDHARRLLDSVLEAVDPDGADRTAELVMAVSASAGLLDAAQDADLLVVGTRRHSKLERFFGSVAAQCAQYSPCPFVAVPVAAPLGGDAIAVAFDGSDSSASALRWSEGVASRRGLSLRVIGVWEHKSWMGQPLLADDPVNPADRALEGISAAVHSVLGDSAVPIEYVPIHDTDKVAPSLVEASEGTVLLAMGSRGRGGFKGLMLGSVSQRCLESSPIPVAVLRSPY